MWVWVLKPVAVKKKAACELLSTRILDVARPCNQASQTKYELRPFLRSYTQNDWKPHALASRPELTCIQPPNTHQLHPLHCMEQFGSRVMQEHKSSAAGMTTGNEQTKHPVRLRVFVAVERSGDHPSSASTDHKLTMQRRRRHKSYVERMTPELCRSNARVSSLCSSAIL